MQLTPRSVVASGRTVRWHVVGAGPPLVCVHGLAASHRWWSRVAAGLAGRYELHLVDVPRFTHRFGPAAAADWLVRWLAAARIARPVLIGHSLGGLLAAQVAARTQLDRLVLVAPAGVPSRRPLARDAYHLVMSGGATRRFVPTILADTVRCGPSNVLRGGFYVRRTDLSAELARIPVPTLLLWGDRDRLVPYELAQAWIQALPNAHLVTLAGAGHVAIVESAERVVDAVLEFLDQPCDEPRVRPMDGVRSAANDDDARVT